PRAHDDLVARHGYCSPTRVGLTTGRYQQRYAIEALDGMDVFPILARRAPEVDRTLFWRVIVPNGQRAVRSGDWKLVVDGGSSLLFNVRTDVGERIDMTNQRLDIAQRLRPMITAWEAEVDAEAKANGTNEFNRRRP
ncbi:MAG: Arylsulfatase, partial [Pseudomonadota bacterium]